MLFPFCLVLWIHAPSEFTPAVPAGLPALALVVAPPTPAPPAAGALDPARAQGVTVPPDEKVDENWHGAVDVGASISSGNSDTISSAASADGKKEWEEHRVTLKASWNFAQQDDPTTGDTEVTQRRWSGSGKYDYFFTDRNYAFTSITAENDDLADLNLRMIYAGGLGRKLIVEEDLKLDGEAGLSWIDENYFGQADDDHFMAWRFATNLDYTVTENTTFLQTAELYPSLDFSEFNGTLDSRLRVNMTDKMFAQIQWVARYNNNAPPGTGTTDSTWIVSLGLTY